MRLYLPATIPLLREWLSSGSAMPSGAAYAVTPTLREWYREGDLEELEHAAAQLAAVASLELLAADLTAPTRRVVLAVDVDDGGFTPDLDERGALRVHEPVPRTRWASALVDDPSAGVAVEAALALLRDRSASADDVAFALGEVEAADLGWYAVQELAHLVD
ncbi:MAG TPA: hypothetical protein VHB18_08670 [Mycobacteriales bacterium]|jgi:hypothetical protein|nr:hypothetical protein [Mycobacteriales bacterium]